MLIVSMERNKHLQSHSGQTHAELVVTSQAPREHSLQTLWKEYVVHDADQNAIGTKRDEVGKVTVIKVSESTPVSDMTIGVAQACGHKTNQALREAWAAKHPRTSEATVVWFVLGDWRDRDRYLAWTGRRAGSDEKGYTRSRRHAIDPDAPVPDEIVEAYAAENRLKDEARRAKASAALASEPAWERVQRLYGYIEYVRDTRGEAAARTAYANLRQHFRVMEQRVRRWEGRNS